MLDQNTDRMWFVIGAVIVGAAIIFIANGSLPTLFASVTDSFQGVATEATGVIAQIGRERMPFDMQEIEAWNYANIEWLSETSIKLTPTYRYYGGVRIDASRFKMGRTYTIAFDMQTLSGDIHGIGGHMDIASEAQVTVDGVARDRWYGGDNVLAQNDWMHGVDYPRDNEMHHVEVSFTVDQASSGNNPRVYIQPNRTDYGRYPENALDYSVLIENIELYEYGKEGE